jgi:hypothetical protein
MPTHHAPYYLPGTSLFEQLSSIVVEEVFACGAKNGFSISFFHLSRYGRVSLTVFVAKRHLILLLLSLIIQHLQ